MPTEAGTIFELLIGGPNQSHKVNFKELPFREECSSELFGDLSSTHFSEISKKNFNGRFKKLCPPLPVCLEFSRPANRRDAEHATATWRFKMFFRASFKSQLNTLNEKMLRVSFFCSSSRIRGCDGCSFTEECLKAAVG